MVAARDHRQTWSVVSSPAVPEDDAVTSSPLTAAAFEINEQVAVALEALEGSCRTPLGAYARIEDDLLLLSVEALSPDGRLRFRRDDQLGVPASQAPEGLAREFGLLLGRQIREEAGDRIVWA